jgi:FkbH-like protein
MDKIKLVVWDMDETFWKGTISEGPVEVLPENVRIVRTLVDRGIMCSISSKNDHDVVMGKLHELGIDDLFVFPRINWEAKGAQIRDVIADCRLRDVNVLFVDDNPHNLEEARFLSPRLNTALPSDIGSLLDSPALEGNPDPGHSRLRQFKILEAKERARKTASSNEEFLFASHVRVDVAYDCSSHKDRLLDLINRSNQLNFTKSRLDMAGFERLLDDRSAKTAYVSVRDDFGDYGIVGFVAVRNGECEHFLFSCRTIGLGVEQWAYAFFGYPKLTVVGEVIGSVDRSPPPPWINHAGTNPRPWPRRFLDKRVFHSHARILLRGGCDLMQMLPYLKFRHLDCEFNHLKYHRDHTVFAVDCLERDERLMAESRKNVPFVWDNTFETGLFSGKYDVVVLSCLIDYIQAVYRSKENHAFRLAYGNWTRPEADAANSWLGEHFDNIGRISAEDFEDDLCRIIDALPPRTLVVFINGCEVEHENPAEPGMCRSHRELNAVVDKVVERHSRRARLIDMRKIIAGRGDLTDNIRHYKREVYRRMAESLTEIVDGATGGWVVRMASRWRCKW